MALALGFALPGTYPATLTDVRDAGGSVLATSATSFTVLSTAATGSGLAGTLIGTPKPVPFGDPIAFNATVNNLGNATSGAEREDLDRRPAAQQVLAEVPATLALARAQSGPFPSAAGHRGGWRDLCGGALGDGGHGDSLLAQDSFVIAPPVTRVAGTLAAIPKQVPQGGTVT